MRTTSNAEAPQEKVENCQRTGFRFDQRQAAEGAGEHEAFLADGQRGTREEKGSEESQLLSEERFQNRVTGQRQNYRHREPCRAQLPLECPAPESQRNDGEQWQ